MGGGFVESKPRGLGDRDYRFRMPLCYSWRRASTGWTLVAEWAGMAQAAIAAAARRPVMAASMVGLAAPMPSSLPARARLETTLTIAPRRKPAIRTRPVDPRTSLKTFAGVAPNAMRMPNSRVRRETA